jgi:hypothetical protein
MNVKDSLELARAVKAEKSLDRRYNFSDHGGSNNSSYRETIKNRVFGGKFERDGKFYLIDGKDSKSFHEVPKAVYNYYDDEKHKYIPREGMDIEVISRLDLEDMNNFLNEDLDYKNEILDVTTEKEKIENVKYIVSDMESPVWRDIQYIYDYGTDKEKAKLDNSLLEFFNSKICL